MAVEHRRGVRNALEATGRWLGARTGLATARGGAGSPVCRALGPRERYGLLQLE